MRNYSQPTFYHFSQDSIDLAKFIQKKIKRNNIRALEIGCGCGVISFELIDYGLDLLSITCIELQPGFEEPFLKNQNDYANDVKVELIVSDFLTYVDTSKYDLIYFNPPYYLRGHGRESQDPNTAICRSIDQEHFKTWLERAFDHLAPHGQLFFCINHTSVEKLQPIIEASLGGKIQNENFGSCIIYYLSGSE